MRDTKYRKVSIEDMHWQLQGVLISISFFVVLFVLQVINQISSVITQSF